MKAIIKEELVRKSRLGKSILTFKIIGTKDNIVEKAQDYITKRISETNKIPVKCFHIEIQNQRGRKIDKWIYTPTYR